MATYLDFLIGSGSRRSAQPSTYVSRPVNAANFGAFARGRQANADREQREAAAVRANELGQARLGLDQQRFGLEQQRFGLAQDNADQAKRQFFAGKVKEALALINSGDPDKVAAGEALLQSAGGTLNGGAPPLDATIGTPPPGTIEEALLGPQPTKQEAEVEAAKNSLRPLEQLSQDAALPQDMLGAMDSIGFAGQGVSDEALLAPPPEPPPPAGPGVGTSDMVGDEGLGVTSGIPYAANAMDGTASSRPFTTEPGKAARDPEEARRAGSPEEDFDVTSMAMEAAEDAPPPVRIRNPPDTPAEQMTKQIVDPFGNVIGEYHVGDSDEVVASAMEPVAGLIQAYTAMTPDFPTVEALAMAEASVRNTLSDFEGSRSKAEKAAYDKLRPIMETMNQNARADKMAPEKRLDAMAGMETSDIDKGDKAVEKIVKSLGIQGLKGTLTNTNESVRMLSKMQESIKKGVPVDTIAFYSIVYQVAKGRDPGGRITDKDFDYAKGRESLIESVDSFVGRTLGISGSQFIDDFNSVRTGTGGAATISPITIDRFSRHMMSESVRLGERKQEAIAEVTRLHAGAKEMGKWMYANGIAQGGNLRFDASLPIKDRFEIAAENQDMLHRLMAQQVEQSRRQQDATMTPEQREQKIDALIGGAGQGPQ